MRKCLDVDLFPAYPFALFEPEEKSDPDESYTPAALPWLAPCDRLPTFLPHAGADW